MDGSFAAIACSRWNLLRSDLSQHRRSIGEVFVPTLENDAHSNDVVNVNVSEVMDGTISLSVGDHSTKVAIFKSSSQSLNITRVTSWCQSVDDQTVAAITLEIVEVGIDQGLTMVWLVEIKGSLNATVIPVEVHTSASGIEINVSNFGDIIVISISGFGILMSRGTQDAVKVEVEVSVVSAETIGAVSLGSGGVVRVLGFEGGIVGEGEAMVRRGANGVDVI